MPAVAPGTGRRAARLVTAVRRLPERHQGGRRRCSRAGLGHRRPPQPLSRSSVGAPWCRGQQLPPPFAPAALSPATAGTLAAVALPWADASLVAASSAAPAMGTAWVS